MKRSLQISILLLTMTALVVWSCGQEKEVEIPEDLEGKKELLVEKQSELRALQHLITELKADISEMDPGETREPIEVNAITLEKDTFQRYVTVQANIEAEDVVNASSEIGGRITRMYVDEGDRVKRGALIAATDVRTIENQVTELETSLQLATTVYERQKRLWDQNIGSEIQYLEAKNNKERLEKSLETLKTQLSKQYVYSPISGVVDMKFLNAGEMASPGMPIVQILDTDKVIIKADLQESLLGKVDAGDEVEVYFPALDLTVTENITSIGRKIDLNNRTFDIEIATSSRNGTLKPNLLAEVRINDHTQYDAIIVPLSAIKEEVSGRKFVFLVEDTDTVQVAHKSYVTLGEGNLGYVVIKDGIQPGDVLVTDGGGSLTDGDPVITHTEMTQRNGQ